MKKVSIVIINYQLCDVLRNCLNSIYKWESSNDYDIIVIDNHSPNSSWKSLISEFPFVRFYENGSNIGFSRANNSAVRLTNSKYILFLNPDTEFLEPTLQQLYDFAEKTENLGAIGVRMQDANQKFLPESKRSVPNLSNSFSKLFLSFFDKKYYIRKSYYRGDLSENEISEVEVLTGAFLWMKKDDFLAIKGFDEKYFMYGEDIDLCYTLILSGKKNYYFGKISLMHLKGESTIKNKVYLSRFYGAMHLFLKKYYKNQHPKAYWFLVFGLKLKHFIETFKLCINAKFNK